MPFTFVVDDVTRCRWIVFTGWRISKISRDYVTEKKRAIYNEPRGYTYNTRTTKSILRNVTYPDANRYNSGKKSCEIYCSIAVLVIGNNFSGEERVGWNIKKLDEKQRKVRWMREFFSWKFLKRKLIYYYHFTYSKQPCTGKFIQVES